MIIWKEMIIQWWSGCGKWKKNETKRYDKMVVVEEAKQFFTQLNDHRRWYQQFFHRLFSPHTYMHSNKDIIIQTMGDLPLVQNTWFGWCFVELKNHAKTIRYTNRRQLGMKKCRLPASVDTFLLYIELIPRMEKEEEEERMKVEGRREKDKRNR